MQVMSPFRLLVVDLSLLRSGGLWSSVVLEAEAMGGFVGVLGDILVLVVVVAELGVGLEHVLVTVGELGLFIDGELLGSGI